MKQHNLSIRQEALRLLKQGVPNHTVAKRLIVPRGTVGWWRHQERKQHGERAVRPTNPICPICHSRALDGSAYAYLLGLYLGDGYISHYAKHRAPSLMITLDDAWPGLQEAATSALKAVFPGKSVCLVRRTGCHDVKVYFKHLKCLFPQHGPGKKHERAIELHAWQREIVDEHPWEFIRGLIHSDGCRITNWTEKVIGGKRKRYEYARYFFTNTSTDILRLFTDTLDKVGVEWRPCNQSRSAQNVSVARKASVALMDAHVGPKY